jgi:hypothetical protein
LFNLEIEILETRPNQKIMSSQDHQDNPEKNLTEKEGMQTRSVTRAAEELTRKQNLDEEPSTSRKKKKETSVTFREEENTQRGRKEQRDSGGKRDRSSHPPGLMKKKKQPLEDYEEQQFGSYEQCEESIDIEGREERDYRRQQHPRHGEDSDQQDSSHYYSPEYEDNLQQEADDYPDGSRQGYYPGQETQQDFRAPRQPPAQKPSHRTPPAGRSGGNGVLLTVLQDETGQMQFTANPHAYDNCPKDLPVSGEQKRLENLMKHPQDFRSLGDLGISRRQALAVTHGTVEIFRTYMKAWPQMDRGYSYYVLYSNDLTSIIAVTWKLQLAFLAIEQWSYDDIYNRLNVGTISLFGGNQIEAKIKEKLQAEYGPQARDGAMKRVCAIVKHSLFGIHMYKLSLRTLSPSEMNTLRDQLAQYLFELNVKIVTILKEMSGNEIPTQDVENFGTLACKATGRNSSQNNHNGNNHNNNNNNNNSNNQHGNHNNNSHRGQGRGRGPYPRSGGGRGHSQQNQAYSQQQSYGGGRRSDWRSPQKIAYVVEEKSQEMMCKGCWQVASGNHFKTCEAYKRGFQNGHIFGPDPQ